MKIVYVLDALANKAGTERMISFKMNYLSERNYEIYFITASQGKHPFSFNLSSKITCIDLNINFHRIYKYRLLFRFFKELQLCFLLKKRIKKVISIIDPDIIIATTYTFSDIVCNLDCRAKKLIESHGNKSFLNYVDKSSISIKNIYNTIKRNIIIKSIEDKCDVLVTLTEGDSNQWNTSSKKIIIPNPLPINCKEYSTLNNRKVISVGRLVPEKRFDILILAWKIVSEKHNDWILDIYGNRSLYDNLIMLIKKLNLSDSCFIHPSTENIAEEYINSSIYVMSSISEGFGLVLAEAMSFGIPCISFNCPYGPAEVIKNGEDGFLVDNGDYEKLADKMCLLIEDEEQRKIMGCNARKNIQRYSPNIIMKKWEDLFESLV